VPRWIDAYCGKVKLLRTHGWCPHCQQWVFPADRLLGLRNDSTASPWCRRCARCSSPRCPPSRPRRFACA
jgi:hypothetical protein